MEEKNDVMRSVLKLMRALRRHPMRPNHEFPPAVGRMLLTLQANDGASPAELCEVMDVRPSSMSELLARMEENGLVRRESNENDRRATRVFLSDTGKDSVLRMEEKYREDNAKLSACFTEEELAQFCALCDRLSAHVEGLPGEVPCGPHGPHGCHGNHKGHGHHGPHKGYGPRPGTEQA